MINTITSSLGLNFNTRRTVISTGDEGRIQLHKVLSRINECKDIESNNTSMQKLRAMFADQIHLAYKDWKEFCYKWQVTVYSDKDITQANTMRLRIMNRDNDHDIKFDFVL